MGIDSASRAVSTTPAPCLAPPSAGPRGRGEYVEEEALSNALSFLTLCGFFTIGTRLRFARLLRCVVCCLCKAALAFAAFRRVVLVAGFLLCVCVRVCVSFWCACFIARCQYRTRPHPCHIAEFLFGFIIDPPLFLSLSPRPPVAGEEYKVVFVSLSFIPRQVVV